MDWVSGWRAINGKGLREHGFENVAIRAYCSYPNDGAIAAHVAVCSTAGFFRPFQICSSRSILLLTYSSTYTRPPAKRMYLDSRASISIARHVKRFENLLRPRLHRSRHVPRATRLSREFLHRQIFIVRAAGAPFEPHQISVRGC